MKVTIEGDPEEIAVLELALKDGNKNFVPRTSNGFCVNIHANGRGPIDSPESISTALQKAIRKSVSPLYK